MPISILIRILIGAIGTIGVAIAITGMLTKTDIISKIKEFIQQHKYKKKNKNTNSNVNEDADSDEDEDIIGAMINEVCKNHKTVKADVLNKQGEVVATEVFECDDVSADIKEGDLILI